MWDILIRGGLIFDGTEPRVSDGIYRDSTMYRADIVIKDGKICGIGDFAGEKAETKIEADGLVASPGFIDIHSHADGTLIANPFAESKIRQGVTTEVVGNCGSSPGPLEGEAREACQRAFGSWGVEVTWNGLGEYLELIGRRGCSVNVAALVGHGTVRAGVVGYEGREADEKELLVMKGLVRGAMMDGAFGLSSGLAYSPGCFAPTNELVELCRVVREYGGIYVTHLRNEGDGLVEALEEAIGIASEARVRLQVSHHKAVGRRNWGKTTVTLARLEEAQSHGLSIGFDAYPYTAAATSLSSLLPRWAVEGGSGKMLKRLSDSSTRRRVVLELKDGSCGIGATYGWENLAISRTSTRKNEVYQGMSFSDLSAFLSRDPAELAIDLLIEEEGSVGIVLFAMEEGEVSTVLRHPLCAVGSDASAWAPYGVLGEGKPHPRGYGAFPRVLGKYVREERLFSLEEALWKMTGLPARIMGLTDRGRLSPGLCADVTLFDPGRIRDTATYSEPHSFPEGIEYVIVNGVITIRDGKHLGVLAGKPLRKGKQDYSGVRRS